MKLYRQGDVLIRRIDKIPLRRRKSTNDDRRRLILAHGEATGHAHVIDAKPSEARLRHGSARDARELTFLEVLSPTGVELVHDEHDTIVIPPGDYEVTRQREYSPAQAAREARVRD